MAEALAAGIARRGDSSVACQADQVLACANIHQREEGACRVGNVAIAAAGLGTCVGTARRLRRGLDNRPVRPALPGSHGGGCVWQTGRGAASFTSPAPAG